MQTFNPSSPLQPHPSSQLSATVDSAKILRFCISPDCSICQDPVLGEGKPIAYLSCGHCYHLHCIQGWTLHPGSGSLRIQNLPDRTKVFHIKCPLCRGETRAEPSANNPDLPEIPRLRLFDDFTSTVPDTLRGIYTILTTGPGLVEPRTISKLSIHLAQLLLDTEFYAERIEEVLNGGREVNHSTRDYFVNQSIILEEINKIAEVAQTNRQLQASATSLWTALEVHTAAQDTINLMAKLATAYHSYQQSIDNAREEEKVIASAAKFEVVERHMKQVKDLNHDVRELKMMLHKMKKERDEEKKARTRAEVKGQELESANNTLKAQVTDLEQTVTIKERRIADLSHRLQRAESRAIRSAAAKPPRTERTSATPSTTSRHIHNPLSRPSFAAPPTPRSTLEEDSHPPAASSSGSRIIVPGRGNHSLDSDEEEESSDDDDNDTMTGFGHDQEEDIDGYVGNENDDSLAVDDPDVGTGPSIRGRLLALQTPLHLNATNMKFTNATVNNTNSIGSHIQHQHQPTRRQLPMPHLAHSSSNSSSSTKKKSTTTTSSSSSNPFKTSKAEARGNAGKMRIPVVFNLSGGSGSKSGESQEIVRDREREIISLGGEEGEGDEDSFMQSLQAGLEMDQDRPTDFKPVKKTPWSTSTSTSTPIHSKPKPSSLDAFFIKPTSNIVTSNSSTRPGSGNSSILAKKRSLVMEDDDGLGFESGKMRAVGPRSRVKVRNL